ncbi:hypothetical protein [Leisingera sp. M523]|uniref:hypothetical protein n=1 Tax=Leisingera sp. M523 TaxID=2867013 RepID=UPI0021A69066|nr:hypothetical protein [Leisingera sp. M523]UWQ30053.1 hypothetical protein K3557_05785 [Leisingera sp. M523]
MQLQVGSVDFIAVPEGPLVLADQFGNQAGFSKHCVNVLRGDTRLAVLAKSSRTTVPPQNICPKLPPRPWE